MSKTLNRFASKRDRETLWALQDGKCALCKAGLGDVFHVDHIQPFSQKGSGELWNLQALCPPCHQAKTKVDSSCARARKS